ncbi:MAG: hypothetical protein MJZ29_03075 [Bacteroidaceae bacterium]|nr:hypothetical protein [Bacteroidaceae bacterium]
MKKLYRVPRTKAISLTTEDIMNVGVVISGTDVDNGTGGYRYSKENGTIFDDLFDKVEGPRDMTVEENDYSTHTTIE